MQFRFLLVFIFCSTSVFAQMQREKGDLALKNGNALSGTLTYYYDKPNELSFYNEQGAKQIFHPDEIQEVKLANGERFVAKSFYKKPDSVTLILQVLIESSQISLFMREDDANQYFYVSKNGVLHRLENNDVIINQNKRKYKKKDNKYVATLSSLMSDRVDILDKLQKVNLEENDLARVVTDYNKGNVTYFWKVKSDREKESNWVAFSQYSQYGSFYREPTVAHSFGQMVGVQYYFSKSSRHSIKLSLEQSNYYLDYERFRSLGLGVRYEYSFIKTENSGVYFMVHVADFANFETQSERSSEVKSQILVLPRLSPGLGFEIKPLPKMAVYAEVNHLLSVKQIPKSFSLGIKYDLGRTSW